MKKEYIFRDTTSWYLNAFNYVSQHLLTFAVNNAGNKILDVGCAVGEYCQKLNELGFKCVGVDNNPEYISKVKEKGVEAYVMNGKALDFPDKSFDTVLLFEVLEHLDNPNSVLKEAKRVAIKNILITVPNCTEFSLLRGLGLTYEHMLEKDHINFFTEKDLENLLSKHFKKFRVEEGEPIAVETIGLPRWLKYFILVLYRLKFVRGKIYNRLYAVVEVNE